MLSVEISTIYRRGERTRKVHHLIYAPSFDAADRITAALAKIGNLASDGRPILGLDSRDLLDITGLRLIRAAFRARPRLDRRGSPSSARKSGFDACAGRSLRRPQGRAHLRGGDRPVVGPGDELGLFVAGLVLRLVSNLDAHSPPVLGREATVFDTDLDYFAMAAALRTGNGLDGTIEFFPRRGSITWTGTASAVSGSSPSKPVNWIPSARSAASPLPSASCTG